MILRPFFTYYGGKHRAAKLYPEPAHNTVIEPFAGSAGYACRYPHRNIVLYDMSPVICMLWKWLIRCSENDILSLPTTVQTVKELDVCREAKFLIGFWINKGCVEPRNVPSSWFKSGLRPDSVWGDVIKHRIAKQLKYIRHWRVVQCDYRSIPNRIATWFIDPPYDNAAGDRYIYGVKNYTHLGAWCRTRRGEVVVCENEGATWLPFKPLWTPIGFRGKHRDMSIMKRESIWYRQG